MPTLITRCDDATKAAFGALAASEGVSESALLLRLAKHIARVSGADALPVPAIDRSALGKNVHFRLPQQEREAAQAIALADGRTLPGWIRAVIRRVALKGVAFNAVEMNTLRATLTALGAVGRNLNAVVHYMRRSDRFDPSSVQVVELTALVSSVRAEVLQLIERANSRYEDES